MRSLLMLPSVLFLFTCNDEKPCPKRALCKKPSIDKPGRFLYGSLSTELGSTDDLILVGQIQRVALDSFSLTPDWEKGLELLVPYQQIH
jgi:hypothetical protein